MPAVLMGVAFTAAIAAFSRLKDPRALYFFLAYVVTDKLLDAWFERQR